MFPKLSNILTLRGRDYRSNSSTHVVNVHNLQKVAMLKLSTEYNGRAAIIEKVRAWRSATEIIPKYPRATVYDVVAKYDKSCNTLKEKSFKGARCQKAWSHSTGSRADFRGSGKVDLKIVVAARCEPKKYAWNRRGRPPLQVLYD